MEGLLPQIIDAPRDINACRQYIEAALEYADGSHSFEDICELVVKGGLQFWPGPNSVIITEIIEYPKFRVLNFFLAGGNLSELEVMYPAVEAWGQAQGCSRAVFTGRKGWERTFLARKDWLPTLVVYEKKFA